MKKLLSAEPARVIAVVTAGIAVLAGAGLTINSGLSSGIVAFVGAVLALAQGEVTRSQVTPATVEPAVLPGDVIPGTIPTTEGK